MNEDFFGIKREEEPVQDLYAEEQEAKNGGAIKHVDGGGGKKFGRKGGSGMGGNGKILSIAVVLSLLIALACSWFMVQMLGATKSDVNGVITTVNGLSTRVGDVEDTGLTPADLEGLATESFVTGKGYTTVTSVDAKISALNTSLRNDLGGGVSPTPVATGPKITLMSGGLNVSVNGSCVSNTAVAIPSGSVWTKSITGSCVLNLTASVDTLHSYYGTFTGWEINGLLYTTNPITVNVSSDTTIDAVSNGYGNVVSYTLTYVSGANGSISGTTPQTIYRGGNGSQILAVANSGYAFNNWSDASTQNPRTDTNVLGPVTVTANFKSCSAVISTGGSSTHTQTTANLSWTGSNSNYTVYLTLGTLDMMQTTTNSCQFTGLTADTSYNWRVQSIGCDGSQQWSTTWNFVTDP